MLREGRGETPSPPPLHTAGRLTLGGTPAGAGFFARRARGARSGHRTPLLPPSLSPYHRGERGMGTPSEVLFFVLERKRNNP